MDKLTNRSVRIFLSSTFLDFAAERNLLQSEVFPEIRQKMREKGIEVTDVDLRWGVNESETQGGMALRICLEEIDKARPWKDGEMPKNLEARRAAKVIPERVFFVGMLGERYGWVPKEQDNLYQGLLEDHDWLVPHQHVKSVTELEILHGVLENPKLAGLAFFYFRDSKYADNKNAEDFRDSEPDKKRKLQELKQRIRQEKKKFVRNYANPQALVEIVKLDLLAALEADFKDIQALSGTEKVDLEHYAYARPRRNLYLGGGDYLKWLDKAVEEGKRRLLIEGESGGGKSALIANWLHDYGAKNPKDWVFEHYCGLGDEAADPVKMVTRLCQFIKDKTQSPDELKSTPQEILLGLRQWLINAQFHAKKQNCRLVIALDAVNNLRGEFADLRWWPGNLNDQLPAVTVVASCLPGAVLQALQNKDSWQSLKVQPLDEATARKLFIDYLEQYRKHPKAEQIAMIFDGKHRAKEAGCLGNPLFIRTMAEELRVLAPPPKLPDAVVVEELSVSTPPSKRSDAAKIAAWLDGHIKNYLTCGSVTGLFKKVLERIESYLGEGGIERLQSALASIWVSRAGLSESEVRGIVGRQLGLENSELPQQHWAVLRYNLGEGLMEVSDGRLKFSHDFLKSAVESRYLDGGNQKAIHDQRVTVAEWFSAQPVTARSAEEIPYQWQESGEWERLRQCLTQQPIVAELLKIRTGEYHLMLLAYWLAVENHTAVKMQDQYQTAWDKWYGKDGQSEAEFTNQLHLFLNNTGRYGDFTLKLAQLFCELILAEHGPDNPHIAVSLNNLAKLYEHKGEYDAAEPFYNRALAIYESKLGPDDSGTALCLNNLAGLLLAKGKHADFERNYEAAEGYFAAAETHFSRALEIREAQLGPDHPHTAASLNGLALLLATKGDNAVAKGNYKAAEGYYATAETHFGRALEINEAQFGHYNPETTTSLNNLAQLLAAKWNCAAAKGNNEAAEGYYSDAEQYFRCAQAIIEAQLGPYHPNTAASLNNLAKLLDSKGEYHTTEPLFRRVMEIDEAQFGPDHTETAFSLEFYATLLHKTGHSREALTLLERALMIFQQKLGEEHQSTKNCRDLRDVARDSLGSKE